MKYISFILILIPSLALAAPSITGYSGTLSQGSTITISGSNFGTKAVPAPVLWDTVDNQSAYSSLSNGATIPSGGSNPWPTNTSLSPGAIKLTSTGGRNGTKGYTSTGESGTLEDLSLPTSTQIYVSWWWMPSTNAFVNTNESDKFIRLSNASNQTTETFSWEQMSNYVYSNAYCQGGGGENWYTWAGNANQWNFQEVFIDSSAQTTTVRLNGVTVTNAASWNGCSPFNFNQLWKIGFDGGGTSPTSITQWMDDIYVDNSFARVMIGDASTFSTSTHFEMQPLTSWGPSSIGVTVNQGSFANGSSVYLYVVDSTGTPAGYGPITFSGTPPVVNGACGSDNGGSFSSLSSSDANLCSAGTVASFSGTGPWTWGCNGSGGGTPASCSASVSVPASVIARASGKFGFR